MNTNNQTAFTPGPWHATYFTGHPFTYKVVPSHMAARSSFGMDDFPSHDEAEANAHLIAAAPEMYKALKNVWERVEFKNYPDEMRQLVENALAKAEEK